MKAQNNLGLALDGLNRTEEAMEAYRAAIQPKTNSSGAGNLGSEQPRLNLAIDLIHRDRLSEALPPLKEAAATSPSDPKIYEQLGHLYLPARQTSRGSELPLPSGRTLAWKSRPPLSSRAGLPPVRSGRRSKDGVRVLGSTQRDPFFR